ncbi:hypothetical protein LINGRAHAP2_LOCUS24531 [Linum grandiflorum]
MNCQRESPHLPWIMTRLGLLLLCPRSEAQKWRVVVVVWWSKLIEIGERPQKRK